MSNTSASELTLAVRQALRAAVPFDIEAVRERLEASGGGLEIVQVSPGLEIRVEVLSAPGPGDVRVEPGDSVYVVLSGSGIVGVEGTPASLLRGEAVVVPGGARHVFVTYERLSLLVTTTRRWA